MNSQGSTCYCNKTSIYTNISYIFSEGESLNSKIMQALLSETSFIIKLPDPFSLSFIPFNRIKAKVFRIQKKKISQHVVSPSKSFFYYTFQNLILFIFQRRACSFFVFFSFHCFFFSQFLIYKAFYNNK